MHHQPGWLKGSCLVFVPAFFGAVFVWLGGNPLACADVVSESGETGAFGICCSLALTFVGA